MLKSNKSLLRFICFFFLSSVSFAALDRHAHPYLNRAYTPLDTFGYLDGSYNYLLRSNEFISGVNNRVYDLAENGFTLQQASLAIAENRPQGLGGYINFVLGRDALNIAPAGYNADIFNSQNLGFVVAQAYLHYVQNSFAIKAGEMSALAGLEQYDYTKDTNFSRGILDGYAQPGQHLGVRGIARVTENLSLIVGAINGWSTIKNATDLNTAEFAISYSVPQISFMINGYLGPQHLIDNSNLGPSSTRSFFDFFATVKATDALSFAINYDNGTQAQALLPDGTIGRAVWHGIAGYINYIWNEKWRTSLRGELFADSDGFRTGVKQNWREMTLTLGYNLFKNMLIRAETRHDFSNVPAFLDKNSINTSNNQQSYALEALWQFG